MQILIDKLLDSDGKPVTGLNPVIITMYDTVTLSTIVPPTIDEISNSGFYITADIYITNPVVIMVDAGLAVGTEKRYSTYFVEPAEKIDASYTFIENIVSVQVVMLLNNSPIAVDSVTMKIYDEDNDLIETRTGSDNGAYYYNIVGQVDLTANQNMRIDLEVVKATKTYTKTIFLPTQLIRI